MTRLIRVGHLVYAMLAVLALIFYKERTIFSDASFQLFEIIWKESFAIQANRFGAACTQAFPLVAVKLGSPLKTVLIAYSLSFVLFQYFAFLFSAYILKNQRIAICIFAWHLLMTTHTFFWIQNEFVQGASLFLVSVALMQYNPKSRFESSISWILLLVLIYSCVYFHPLILIVFLYTLSYLLLANFKFRAISKAWGLGFLSLFIYKHFLDHTPGYDNTSYARLESYLVDFSQIFEANAGNLMMEQFCGAYSMVYFLALVLATYFLFEKKYKLFMLLLGASALYILLVIANQPGGFVNAIFHGEAHYLPLAFFIALPLSHEVLTAKSNKWYSILIIAFAFIRLSQIYQAHNLYENRLVWVERKLDNLKKQGRSKGLLISSQAPIGLLKAKWAFAYESLLLSALEHPDSTRTIHIIPDDVDPSSFKHYQMFYGRFSKVLYKDINPYYFSFSDTLSRYKLQQSQ